MIFSVQRYLEDHFARRGLTDVDQYAIRLANAFERTGRSSSEEALLRAFARLRTVFYRSNHVLDRRGFEAQIAATLRKRFQKKKNEPGLLAFERGFAPARARLKARRRSVGAVLSEFKVAVEARAIDIFWNSRKQHRLRSRPETIAQALLAVFSKGVIGSEGVVLREISSGIGFVDVGISFGRVLHLLELKILRYQLKGADQLATYMRTEARASGWLVLFDARRTSNREAVPVTIDTPVGSIRTLLVDINPTAPHVR